MLTTSIGRYFNSGDSYFTIFVMIASFHSSHVQRYRFCAYLAVNKLVIT